MIKTVEQSIPLSEGYSAFHLFSEKLIAMHQMQYNYLHIGMVQVALKPATRLGLNTSAIVVVRDKLDSTNSETSISELRHEVKILKKEIPI